MQRFAGWWLLLLWAAFSFLACGGEGPEISIRLRATSQDAATPAPSPTATSHATPTTRPTPTPTPSAVAERDEAERLTAPASVPPSSPYTPLPSIRDRQLEVLLRQALGDQDDSYGIMVKSLTDGRTATINPDATFYAASLFKLPILYEAFKQIELGLLDPTRKLTITPYYAAYDLGSLERLGLQEGDTITVAQALAAMIIVSDNVSAVLLQDLVGPHHVDRDLEALGLQHTSVNTHDLPTSAGDMALLLEMIAQGKAVSPWASRQMRDLLLHQEAHYGLPELLPEDTPVAHKTGNWPGASHDAGIVYSPQATYVIVILSDKSWETTAIAQLSRLVYDYFNGGTLGTRRP